MRWVQSAREEGRDVDAVEGEGAGLVEQEAEEEMTNKIETLRDEYSRMGIELPQETLEKIAMLATDLKSINPVFDPQVFIDCMRDVNMVILEKLRQNGRLQILMKKERHRRRYERMMERGKKGKKK